MGFISVPHPSHTVTHLFLNGQAWIYIGGSASLITKGTAPYCQRAISVGAVKARIDGDLIDLLTVSLLQIVIKGSVSRSFQHNLRSRVS